LRIVDLTGIRVGNEEYTRHNTSYGLTTLRREHARVRGSLVEFRFRGKSGVRRQVTFRDARLARLVRNCKDLHGSQLFHFLDDRGTRHAVHASHLNTFLRSLTAAKYSVKDFRTWSATVKVALDLHANGPSQSERAAKKVILAATRRAAEFLGNTPAVCRKSYVPPALLEAYLGGRIMPEPHSGAAARTRNRARARRLLEERAVLAFLDDLVPARRTGAAVKQMQPQERPTLRKAS
jgi:DNA topoisomerase-1